MSRVGLALVVALAVALGGCLDAAARRLNGTAPPDESASLSVAVAGPRAGRVGEALAFNGSVANAHGGHAYYLWAFGDGAEEKSVDLTDVSHTYAESGRYEVTLVAVDSAGARGGASLALGVDLEARYGGTLAPEPLGARAWSTSFPVARDAARTVAWLNLTRPEGPAALGHPPSVTFQVFGATEKGRPAFEKTVPVPADGALVALDLPRPAPGPWTVAVTMDGGGLVAFSLVAHVLYA